MEIISDISYKEVKDKYDKERDGKIKQRLLIILKAYNNKSSYHISDLADTSHTKVQRWINRFNRSGFGGLYDKERSGRPSLLSKKQQEDLDNKLSRKKEFSIGWRTLEVLNEIKKSFGINYTIRHVRRILHNIGYSKIKPRPFHINKDPVKVKETAKRLKKNSHVWVKNGKYSQEMNSA